MNKVALITGAARRLGRKTAELLHDHQWNIVIHYHHSESEADSLVQQLNQKRENSAVKFKANLNHIEELSALAEFAEHHWQRLDAFVHNASSFYPTPISEARLDQWDDLMNSNLKSAYFLSQYLLNSLRQQKGSIVFVTDINALNPKKEYSIYCAAKAGLWFLTKAFAAELGPEIRVNGVAPGIILWGEGVNEPHDHTKNQALETIPLKHLGQAEDIAETIYFLLNHHYINGQVIPVDGGLSVAGHEF